VVIARLVAAPLVTVALGMVLAKVGFHLPTVARVIVVLVAAMPVAIVCSVMAERYGGDTQLAAQGIFLTTLFSLFTVPAAVLSGFLNQAGASFQMATSSLFEYFRTVVS